MKFLKSIVLILMATRSYVLVAAETPLESGAEKLTPVESLLPMLGGLLAVIFVIFLLAFLFKKLTNFSPNSQNINVLETQVIGHKEKLMIVKVKQQQFLIGVTAHSISQLGEIDNTNNLEGHQPSDNDNSKSKRDSSFGQLLSNLIKPEQDKDNKYQKNVSEISTHQNTIQVN